MKKTTQFRQMLTSSNLEFIMEAHNGLSAKIVEEAGFKGIWGSGLSISAALGVRDNNEASWTQVLDVLEFMADATNIPILLDGDTGYGNFNNMRRLVKKLEQRDVAAVCIEDKLFPKTNSFIGGEAQPLADIDEFCGKIKAGKDAQGDDDFSIVARVEAFIAGWGLKEALRRAEAYRQAGADAILVHSKKSDPSDVEAFMKEWGDRHPIVIVPTKYYTTPTDLFRQWQISLIIWANHNVRAAVTAMQETSRKIFEEESLRSVDPKMVKVAELFRLQGAAELQEAEKLYLPASGVDINAVLLAASQGERLGELTREIPKALLKVDGKSILDTQIEDFNHVGIKDITVVRGFAKDKVTRQNIKTVDNDDFADTMELYSLYLAREAIQENTVISYGDIVYRSYILNDLLNDKNHITMVVEAEFEDDGSYADFVATDQPYSKELFDKAVRLEKVDPGLKKDKADGEFIGLWKVDARGAELVRETLEEMAQSPDFRRQRMADLLNELLKKTPVAVKFIKGAWLDIDNIVNLQKAGDFK